MTAMFFGLAMLVIGLGIGYAVGWNEAKHPGKIKGQIDKLRGKDSTTREE